MTQPTTATISPPGADTGPRGASELLFIAGHAIAAIVAGAATWWLLTTPLGISNQGLVVLIVMALAIVGWTMTALGDTLIALAAALALILTGVAGPEALYASLGSELVWLLIASFVIAAALKASGLSERLMLSAVSRVRSARALFHVLALAISATALFIPSTSGRAALLLPIFLALAGLLADRRLVRALALLFPTVILLSAGGSLIGAGAHLIAADFIARSGGPKLDMLGWMMLCMPFALLTVVLAVEIVLALFLPGDAAATPLDLSGVATRTAWTAHERWLAGVVALTVLGWVTAGWHGASLGVVAIGGAILATLPGRSPLTMKAAMKTVEWDLLVFMAATLMVGEALITTDADDVLTRALIATVGEDARGMPTLMLLAIALIGLAAHLVITSRTARVSVLVPSVGLPVVGLGLDPTVAILTIVMATGFCQTMAASAKPVAIFSRIETDGFGPADLIRLSLHLSPLMVGALMLFGAYLWPLML